MKALMHRLVGNWNYPTSIRFGTGRIAELPGVCHETGMKHPLLVTDPCLARMPMVLNAVDDCKAHRIECDLFCNIKTNPTAENVADGLKAYRGGDHDGVIAFGGGSGIDAGKAIAFMSGQDRPIWDFEDIGDNWKRANASGIAPVIAVPTTSGTGSEVGRAAIITDTAHRVKKVIFHPRMLPSVVIADPVLTIGLPRHLTAATGMDALSHNLEAFCTPAYHPMAEGIALEGIRLVRNWLPRACANGKDLEARSHMMVASTMGATAFQRGLGAMHALSHPLGALYDAHHGLLNAVLMPFVLCANRSAIEEPMARLSRYLGLPSPGFDAVLDWVVALRTEIGIPSSLSEMGIDGKQASQVVRMALADPSSGGNPVPLRAEDYKEIFRRAVAGELGWRGR